MTIVQSMTMRQTLFGDGADGQESLARAVDKAGVVQALGGTLSRLSSAGRSAVATELAQVVGGLLDLDLVDVLLAGWRKHSALMDAAHRSIDNPDAREVVDLATHSMTSVHRPSVDLLIEDVHIATVHLELGVEAKVHGLAATVQAGRLIDLHGGRTLLSAALTCEGIAVARGTGEVDLELVAELGEGLPLLPPRPPA
jgi:hypothetical protein